MNTRLAEIKVAILEDKKKAGVLAALTLLALIVGVRAALKASPKRAAATPAATAQQTAAQPGQPNPITIPSIDPEKLIQTTRRYARSTTLTRDPFALDPEAFPTGAAPKSGSAPSEDQSGDSAPPESEAERPTEILKRMRVRSVIIGPRPVAVVELRAETATRSFTITVGDDLEGFTVSAITADELTLSHNGSTHSLPFEKPRK
ncbi:MAG: hypothetical protein AB7G17_03110 [Phycisphaerales bacterium]